MKYHELEGWDYFKKVFDVIHTTEPKKHGSYYVLKFADWHMIHDTWNSQYNLKLGEANVSMEEFFPNFIKALKAHYRLPSTISWSEADFVDYLYLTNSEVRQYFNKLTIR